MKADWKSYLEDDELGRSFIFIQKGTDQRHKQVYAEFSPSEMEEHRDMVEAVLQEAHVIEDSRNSQGNQK